MSSPTRRPTLAAGLAALFFLGAALFQLWLSGGVGVPAETVLFGVLAIVFAVLWLARLRLRG